MLETKVPACTGLMDMLFVTYVYYVNVTVGALDVLVGRCF